MQLAHAGEHVLLGLLVVGERKVRSSSAARCRSWLSLSSSFLVTAEMATACTGWGSSRGRKARSRSGAIRVSLVDGRGQLGQDADVAGRPGPRRPRASCPGRCRSCSSFSLRPVARGRRAPCRADQAPAHHLDEGELARELVDAGLEHEAARRPLVRASCRRSRLRADWLSCRSCRCHGQGLLAAQRGGADGGQGIGQARRPRRPAARSRRARAPSCPAARPPISPCLDLLVAQGLALEELLHELVVALGGGLDQRLAVLGHLFAQLGGHFRGRRPCGRPPAAGRPCGRSGPPRP